ncbi:hypothetical protein [Brevibacillus porteri]|uniref:hypothetical protein n=1 Tax=Brevibacillus porteri TaxID=2126350 RepID=UPI003D20A5FB
MEDIVLEVLLLIKAGEGVLAKDVELDPDSFRNLLIEMQMEKRLISGVVFADNAGKPSIPFTNTAQITKLGEYYILSRL